MRTSTSRGPRRPILAALLATVGLVAVVGSVVAPAALAADSLTLTTPYPAVVVSPGSKVSFDLSVKTSTQARVNLTVGGAPTGWTTTLQGGGNIIDAVETDGKTAASARLDVTVPATASGTTTITVTASGLGQTATLPLDVRISGQTGDLSLQTDIPSKKGPAGTTFTFTLTLANDTPQDQTFGVDATGPDGWTVSAEIAGTSQAATAVVKAGSSSSITVTAKPPDSVTAGDNAISVVATAGSKQVKQDLQVSITGSYSLTMSTPNQVLSNHGAAGRQTTQQLTITNGGTAPVTNVTLSATTPTNWKVTFDQPNIPSIGPNQTVTVNASILPTTDAIAGDYQVTFTANADQASSASTAVRFTVETSLEWAIVGAGLIVVVFAGLWWVFRRYGRR